MVIKRLLLPLFLAVGLLWGVMGVAHAQSWAYEEYAGQEPYHPHLIHTAEIELYNEEIAWRVGRNSSDRVRFWIYHPGGEYTISARYFGSTTNYPVVYIYPEEGDYIFRTHTSLSNSATWRIWTHTRLMDAGFYQISFESYNSNARWGLHWIKSTAAPVLDPNAEPPPPPTPPPPPLHQTSCYLAIDPSGAVITSTDTLTNVLGITGTVTITDTTVITVPANIITNGDFELATVHSVFPDGWSFSNPLYAASMRMFDDNINSHVMKAQNSISIEMWQDIFLPYAPSYQVGAFMDFPDQLGDGIKLGVGSILAEFISEPHGYIPRDAIINPSSLYHSTVDEGFGVPKFRVIFPDTTPAVVTYAALDDVYLIPVDIDSETGEVLGIYCPAVGDRYQNQNPPPGGVGGPGGTGGTGGYIVPLAGAAGGVCMNCPQPSLNLSLTAIGAWFAYLYCALSNVITCYVFGWLFNILNAILGVWQLMASGLNYLINPVGQTIVNSLYVIAQSYIDNLAMAIGHAFNALGDIWQLMAAGINYLIDPIGQIIIDSLFYIINTYIDYGSRFMERLMEFVSLLIYWFWVGVQTVWGVSVQGIHSVAAWADRLWTGSLPGGFIVTMFAGFLYVLDLLYSMSNVFYAIVTVVIDIVVSTGDALLADPQTINEWAAGAELNSDGLTLMFWGLALFDTTVYEFGALPAVYMLVGFLGLNMIKGLLREWQVILPN